MIAPERRRTLATRHGHYSESQAVIQVARDSARTPALPMRPPTRTMIRVLLNILEQWQRGVTQPARDNQSESLLDREGPDSPAIAAATRTRDGHGS